MVKDALNELLAINLQYDKGAAFLQKLKQNLATFHTKYPSTLKPVILKESNEIRFLVAGRLIYCKLLLDGEYCCLQYGYESDKNPEKPVFCETKRQHFDRLGNILKADLTPAGTHIENDHDITRFFWTSILEARKAAN